jgi:catechol 2,3-dioxygenase-like lactoylglutathione lyase family enzyme
MAIRRIDHVQIAMPRGEESRARRFYGEVLGLTEISKPPALAGRGGAWFELGESQLHLGVDPDFRPAKKAHVGFEVSELDAMAARCQAAGYETRVDDKLDRRRFFVDDPFGNRVEIIEMVIPR